MFSVLLLELPIIIRHVYCNIHNGVLYKNIMIKNLRDYVNSDEEIIVETYTKSSIIVPIILLYFAVFMLYTQVQLSTLIATIDTLNVISFLLFSFILVYAIKMHWEINSQFLIITDKNVYVGKRFLFSTVTKIRLNDVSAFYYNTEKFRWVNLLNLYHPNGKRTRIYGTLHDEKKVRQAFASVIPDSPA